MRAAVSLSLVVCFAALAVNASAGPAPAPKSKAPLSPAAQKTYDAQLRSGRALESAGKYADAITAFNAGLAVAPDDAMLLGEIGASAYLAKDLAQAETATRKAIANASDPNVRGASLYNLGRIREDRKDHVGAVAAYTDSLRARPNAVVRARLTKLDPKAAAALDPYKPVAFTGPFSSIDAFCKLRLAQPGYDDPDHCHCGVNDDKPATLAAPYQQAQWFSYSCGRNDELDADYMLGVKMTAGWYIAQADTAHVGNHCNGGGYSFVDATPIALAPNAVVVHYRQDLDCGNGNGDGDWSETRQIVMGLGASQVPSMTASMLSVRRSTETPNGKPKRIDLDIKIDYAWAADGSFTVTGKTTGLDPTEAGSLLGKHSLAFP